MSLQWCIKGNTDRRFNQCHCTFYLCDFVIKQITGSRSYTSFHSNTSEPEDKDQLMFVRQRQWIWSLDQLKSLTNRQTWPKNTLFLKADFFFLLHVKRSLWHVILILLQWRHKNNQDPEKHYHVLCIYKYIWKYWFYYHKLCTWKDLNRRWN